MISSQSKSRQQLRAEKRVERKSAAKLNNAESKVAAKIKTLLKEVLSEDQLNEIAKKANFILRERQLSPFAMIAILLMGCLNGTEDVSTLETMCCYLAKWFDITLLPQSLQEQINSKECANFIKAISARVMMHEANKIINKLLKKSRNKKSNLFKRILLQDSTVISLPETVSKLFSGCGGAASNAAVKWDIIFDQSNKLILRSKLIGGRINDASSSADILAFAEKGDLVLRDMGYFTLSHFNQLMKKGIEFISRLKINVNIYLNEFDKEPIDIIEYLEKAGINKKEIDIDVFVGKEERTPLRLIALKVPEEVIEGRKQQHKRSRGNGAKPSEEILKWYGYTLMITSISREKLSKRFILNLYRIRWQIELFFKNIKSNLKVDNFTGKNKYRILCLLYSKLILTWITALLFVLAQSLVGQKNVISRFKFTKWLHNLGDWQSTIAEGNFTELIARFKRDQHLLHKQVKRKK